MSSRNNPFACLAASSNETDPRTLARQQQQSNKPHGIKNSNTDYFTFPSPPVTEHGLRVTTQRQASLNPDRSDSVDSPMSPELLAALEASLLTATSDLDSYHAASISSQQFDTRQGQWTRGSASTAQPTSAQHTQQHRPPTIQSSDHRNQFPPLASSSSSQLQTSPSSQTSLSSAASGSLWESFTAVFCTGSPNSSSLAAEAEGEVPWTLVGSPGTVAELAAATGMSPQEVLMAQQTALLQEASRSTTKQHNRAKPACRTRPTVATTAASPQEDFPALASPGSCSEFGPLCAGRSPHAVPAGWRGGRNKPRVQGVKVINRGSGGEEGNTLRPGRLDLHWDLQLDGLKLKEDDADWELAQYDSVGNSYICGDDAAAAATRELLEKQQAAEEEAAARGSGGSSSSSRDKYSIEAVWLHLARGTNKGSGAAGSPFRGPAAAADGLLVPDDEQPQVRGGRSYVGRYDWRPLLAAAKDHGWRPVEKRDGGGGTHVKLRRVVDLPTGSTYVQTMMMACTPGDSQRAIRNAASQFARLDEEKEQLLTACNHGP